MTTQDFRRNSSRAAGPTNALGLIAAKGYAMTRTRAALGHGAGATKNAALAALVENSGNSGRQQAGPGRRTGHISDVMLDRLALTPAAAGRHGQGHA